MLGKFVKIQLKPPTRNPDEKPIIALEHEDTPQPEPAQRVDMTRILGDLMTRLLNEIRDNGDLSVEDICREANSNGIPWKPAGMYPRLYGHTRSGSLAEAIFIVSLYNKTFGGNETLAGLLERNARETPEPRLAGEYAHAMGGGRLTGPLNPGPTLMEINAAKRLNMPVSEFINLHEQMFDCTLKEHVERIAGDLATPQKRGVIVNAITTDMRRCRSRHPGYCLNPAW